MNGNVEYRLEREYVLSQHEVQALAEKVQGFTQSLPEAEQLLLEWLFARASAPSEPDVPEVSGYTYTASFGAPLVGLPDALSIGDGGVRAASGVPPPEAAAGWALCVGKYVRIAGSG